MCSNLSIVSGLVVAVVDASPATRPAVAALLHGRGVAVPGFGTAAAFLKAMADGLLPTCLIADLTLPDLPTFTLLDVLRERQQFVPTILLSGDSEIPSAVDAMRAGAITCIEKPYLARFLLEHLVPLLESDPADPAVPASAPAPPGAWFKG